jgi:hypothetical protein
MAPIYLFNISEHLAVNNCRIKPFAHLQLAPSSVYVPQFRGPCACPRASSIGIPCDHYHSRTFWKARTYKVRALCRLARDQNTGTFPVTSILVPCYLRSSSPFMFPSQLRGEKLSRKWRTVIGLPRSQEEHAGRASGSRAGQSHGFGLC